MLTRDFVVYELVDYTRSLTRSEVRKLSLVSFRGPKRRSRPPVRYLFIRWDTYFIEILHFSRYFSNFSPCSTPYGSITLVEVGPVRLPTSHLHRKLDLGRSTLFPSTSYVKIRHSSFILLGLWSYSDRTRFLTLIWSYRPRTPSFLVIYLLFQFLLHTYEQILDVYMCFYLKFPFRSTDKYFVDPSPNTRKFFEMYTK